MNPSECYAILGLEPGSSMKDIRQAYRKLALRYHPDKDSSQKDGERFRLITDAYQTLRDKQNPQETSGLKFSEIYPEDAVASYDQAEVLFAKGKYFEALSLYDKVTDKLPRHEAAWLRKGDCFSNLRRLEDALICYDKVLQSNPESMRAWNLKGVCLSDLKRYAEALDAFDEAIMLNPRHEVMWNFRGVCLYGLNRLDEAKDSFDKAIKINPKFAPAWRNKGNVLAHLGNKKEGKRCIEQAKKLL